MTVPASSNEDILEAIMQEKALLKASSVEPQLKPNITDEEIIKNHLSQTKPGRGGQKIGADSKMGGPKPKFMKEAFVVKDPWHVPGLKQAMENDHKR
jgi:hypothetical protein|tara:strand:- start:1582 stop:1872 length:291 start_codon:yes stop_codon:yes gene_type:complete